MDAWLLRTPRMSRGQAGLSRSPLSEVCLILYLNRIECVHVSRRSPRSQAGFEEAAVIVATGFLCALSGGRREPGGAGGGIYRTRAAQLLHGQVPVCLP